MRYRQFGRLDWEVSVLGFGVMGLPLTAEGPPEAGQTESLSMIRYAIDHGVNYIDLGYPYDMARHEQVARVVERALRGGYRHKVKISVTVPGSFVDSAEDFDRYLNKQIEWLEADRIDFCLLGRLNRENWPRIKDLGCLGRAEQAVSDGRIDKVGFSFHDHFQILRRILDGYDNWALCQFQYSYMDVTHDPGAIGLTYAADKGMAIVVTEPLKGGRLTKKPPESVAKFFASAPEKRTLADWGLRFAWNHPGVSTVVCDMSTMEQVAEDMAIADSAESEGCSLLVLGFKAVNTRTALLVF